MKSLFLDFEIDKGDRMENLLREIEELDEKAELFIDCNGGANNTTTILYHHLKDKMDYITPIITGNCSSNAFNLLLGLDLKEYKVYRSAYSKIHLTSFDLPIKEILYNPYEDPEVSDFKYYSDDILVVYRNFLSVEELSTIMKGKDVYLTPHRLNSILNGKEKYQEKNKKIFELTL